MQQEDIDFLNKNSGTKFSEVKITVLAKSLTNNEDVIKEIKNFQPCDGWISLQSHSAERVQGVNFQINDEHILAGEFCNSDQKSLSVRFDGDCWRLFAYDESDDGKVVLKKNVKQLSKISDKTFLNYNVYYEFNDKLGYRPYCSSFVGFTEE